MVIANVLYLYIFLRRKELKKLFKAVQGTKISLKKDRLVLHQLEGPSTAFIHPNANGGFKLYFYNGEHAKEPEEKTVTIISTYSKDMRLYSRAEYTKGELVNEFLYDYQTEKKSRRLSKLPGRSHARIPITRTCVRGKKQGSTLQYNYKGYIESGSYTLDGNLIRFKYHYRKNAKYDDELLRAEFILPHLSANVSWCAPPVRHPEKMERWIPHTRVREATFVQGADVYECSWIYDHKFHPKITTTLNGHYVDTPPMIQHDWLGILKKPTGTTFLGDNPLLDFRSLKSSIMGRTFGLNVVHLPVSTSRIRSQLWKAWKKRNDIDGVVIRYLDEMLLRKDHLLQPYWRYRDSGRLAKAEDYLALHADAVTASAELSTDISAWTPLAIRLSDLFSFGQGGDAVVYTRTKSLQPDTQDKLHVVAVDTGTWPNEGGGVSACRRDLVNNLRSIRWHMVVESANDFGLPKHQTEENVESLKVIPLWGLDFMHPSHGMFSNKLDAEVDHMVKEATIEDIKRNFIPTLTALVQGARAITMTRADVKQSTRALVNLNTYFEDSRHWKEVWTSDIVKDTWRELWLSEDMPNTKPPSEWFHTELPTLGHLESALDMWFRYLFIFSIPIPEQIPAVFQASHHSVSAAYGIVCKIKRHCTLQIWDHAISWRETNLYLSSALCTLPPFIRNSLLGLMKLTSALILHHADQVLPCADFFNPGWEVEIGSQRGKLTHRNEFKRKIDPIVNGIPDMQKFSPVTEIKTELPTVTMLSHVWFAKDIKTAILAGDIIMNEWGFDDYRLDIYGALNKAPVYSSECQELIACKGVGTHVKLRGTADPGVVLGSTWVFLNSSVSEGLPLALGEAALTGAPVVATDVGASLRVLTDPDNGEKYSEVVAPNDALSLARAQINILAMLDQWAKYADDPPDKPAPVLPIKPTKKDVEIITKRMYEKKEYRRKLGMMARDIVQKSFSGERYLREHEQMLWIGKSNYEMLGMPERTTVSLATGRAIIDKRRPISSEPPADPQLEKMAHPKAAWVKHASRATSFTSVYMDDGTASSRWSAGRSGTSSVAETISHPAPGTLSPTSAELSPLTSVKHAPGIAPVPESFMLPPDPRNISPSASRRVSFGGDTKPPPRTSKQSATIRRQSAATSVRSGTYARSTLSQVYTAPNSDDEAEEEENERQVEEMNEKGDENV
jgi:glycosyltransferase involved in cell wall biosynthesis